MLDVKSAVSFVNWNGDEIEKARLAAVIDRVPPDEPVLRSLAQMQHADGGFSFWLPDRSVSTVCDTAYVLGWFDDLNVRSGPVVEKAVTFIFEHQSNDGGWDEACDLERLDPPEFLVPGKASTRAWLTAYCAHWMMLFGYADSPLCRGCPVDFILAHQEPSGKLTGYLRATWDALPVIARFKGVDGDAFVQAFRAVEAEYQPRDWAGSYLAWLLRGLRDCNLSADYPFVRRCLHDLVGKQRSDGSWSSEDGERYAVTATIEALRVLRDFDIT